MKKKIKQWIKKWLEDDENNYNPKKSRDLRAVSFTSYSPISANDKLEYLIQCTEWDNGEGFDMTINTFNTLTKKEDNKFFSLHIDEINLILAALNELDYFNID